MKISYSMRQTFKSCPRKVFWKYYCGIERRMFESPSRIVGSAYHLGLETLRRTGDMDLAILTMKEMVIDSDFPWLRDLDRQENIAKLEAYLVGYENKFFDLNHKWMDVEKEIQTDFESAFVDGLMIDEDGKIIVVEDKTRSYLTNNLPLVLRQSDQLLNYLTLLNQGGFYTNTCYYREVQKTKTKMSKTMSLDAYKAKLFSEYSMGDRYQECVITFDKNEIEAYKNEKSLVDIVINICFESGDIDRWPRNSDSCIGNYGQCDFLKLCSTKEHREDYKINDKIPYDDGLMRKKLGVTE